MPATAEPPAPPAAAPNNLSTPQSASMAAAQARATEAANRRGTVASWITGLGDSSPDTPSSTEPTDGSATSQPSTAVIGTSPSAEPRVTAQPRPTEAPSGEPPSPAPTSTPPPSAATASPAKPTDGQLPADPDKWPRSAKEWEQFKQVRNENYRKRDERIAALEKEIAAREERLAAFANAVDPKEHSAVREERDKLSEALRLAAVEKHPRFQAYYDGKLNSQVELAKRIVGPERSEAVAALLKLPESDYRNAKIEELIGDLSPVASTRLGSIINAVDELRTERENEVARAREDYDKATAKQTAEQQAAQTAARTNAEALFERTLKAAQSAEGGLVTLQPRDGDVAWNNAVQQRIATAKNILFGQEKPEDLVRAALAAVSFPAIIEAHSALQAENEQLKLQVASMRSSTPSVQRGVAQAPSDGQRPSTPVKVGNRPMQAAAEWIGLLNQEPAQP